MSLIAVESEAGVLINTSFNVRGKPILNALAEALRLLDDPVGGLDFVVIDDFMFSRPGQTPPP